MQNCNRKSFTGVLQTLIFLHEGVQLGTGVTPTEVLLWAIYDFDKSMSLLNRGFWKTWAQRKSKNITGSRFWYRKNIFIFTRPHWNTSFSKLHQIIFLLIYISNFFPSGFSGRKGLKIHIVGNKRSAALWLADALPVAKIWWKSIHGRAFFSQKRDFSCDFFGKKRSSSFSVGLI